MLHIANLSTSQELPVPLATTLEALCKCNVIFTGFGGVDSLMSADDCLCPECGAARDQLLGQNGHTLCIFDGVETIAIGIAAH